MSNHICKAKRKHFCSLHRHRVSREICMQCDKDFLFCSYVTSLVSKADTWFMMHVKWWEQYGIEDVPVFTVGLQLRARTSGKKSMYYSWGGEKRAEKEFTLLGAIYSSIKTGRHEFVWVLQFYLRYRSVKVKRICKLSFPHDIGDVSNDRETQLGNGHYGRLPIFIVTMKVDIFYTFGSLLTVLWFTFCPFVAKIVG